MIKRRLSKAEAKLLPVMAYQMFALFNKHDKQIYLVGGAVRSLLARFAPINCDFTTDATPEEIVDYLAPFDPFYDNPYGTVAFSFTNEGGEKEIYEILEDDDITGFRVSEVRHRLHRSTMQVNYEVTISPL